MKRILFILPLLCLLAGPCTGQQGILGTVVARTAKPLIIFLGESNSGGYALNSQATAGEVAARESVKILNNTTLASFDNLDIGTNNMTGHIGLEADWSLVHGWELGLANRVEADSFLSSPVYLEKAGAGGSTINQWDEGDTYYENFKSRTDAAVSLLTAINGGVAPSIYIWYSQGINDAIAGTDVATWKAATIAHIAKIRTRYGASIPFFMTELPATYSTYNTAISEIASEVSGVVVIETTDATMRDANHWDYAGMKLIAGRMCDAVLAYE